MLAFKKEYPADTVHFHCSLQACLFVGAPGIQEIHVHVAWCQRTFSMGMLLHS